MCKKCDENTRAPRHSQLTLKSSIQKGKTCQVSVFHATKSSQEKSFSLNVCAVVHLVTNPGLRTAVTQICVRPFCALTGTLH